MNSEHENAGEPRGVRKLLGYVPSVLVLAAIAGVGVWGHKTGWSAPRFADLSRTNQVSEKEDWCAEHGVPQSTCIKCYPELVGANMADWCPEHGVPESKCTICHPEILTTGVAGDWCPEHKMPESSCTICHPEIAVMGEVPASAGTAMVTVVPEKKPEQPVVENDRARPTPKRETCQTHALRVQFASTESLSKAGVSLAQVAKRPMADSVSFNGRSEYDRSRMAAISSPVAGKVWRVLKPLGEKVKAGEVLALIEAPEVGEAKGDLLQAIADVELAEQTVSRVKAASEAGYRTKADLQEAEAAAKAAGIRRYAAQQRLANLGLEVNAATSPDVKEIARLGLPAGLEIGASAPANLLPLTAPLDGTIIGQESVQGEAIDAMKPVLTVADVERMWVRVDLPASLAASVAVGQEATFTPDGEGSQPLAGKITWIDTAVNESTHTLRARVEVVNPEAALKAGTFGQVRVVTRRDAEATVIPADALQWEGCCDIVFVRLADTIFQTRKVQLGARSGGFAEVLNGVIAGEVIASAGSNVLKAEILKSNLGAGCADH